MAVKLTEDPHIIREIIDKCEVCYLGMSDKDGNPYVLPFNFGYEDGTIYLHSGKKGQKTDVLNQNPNVCVTFSTDHILFHRNEGVACSYGMRYRSVLAFGKVVFVDDYEEKIKVLNIIMRKYTGKNFSYNSPAVNNVMTFKVEVSKIEAKVSVY